MFKKNDKYINSMTRQLNNHENCIQVPFQRKRKAIYYEYYTRFGCLTFK